MYEGTWIPTILNDGKRSLWSPKGKLVDLNILFLLGIFPFPAWVPLARKTQMHVAWQWCLICENFLDNIKIGWHRETPQEEKGYLPTALKFQPVILFLNYGSRHFHVEDEQLCHVLLQELVGTVFMVLAYCASFSWSTNLPKKIATTDTQ